MSGVSSERERNMCRDQQVRTRDILSRAPVSRQSSSANRREYWVDLNAAARRRPVAVFESVEDEAEDLMADNEAVIADVQEENNDAVEDIPVLARITRQMVLQRVGRGPVVQEEPETCPEYDELMQQSDEMRSTIAELMEQKLSCDCRMERM